jgi:serine/threonine protein kinase
MAPEVISRKEYIGEQADIWSFGVVVYALGEGRHPFKAETYSELERLVNRGKIEFKKIKDNKFIDFVKKILKPKGSERPTAR